MGIMADIASDVNEILTDTNDFAVPVTFHTPDGVDPAISVVCPGLCIKHNTSFTETGMMISSRTVRVTVTEQALLSLDYPTRNDDGQLALKDHLVSFTDANNQPYSGIITNTTPDDTTGLIVCQVADHIA